jgi:Tetratricopeptide repeat
MNNLAFTWKELGRDAEAMQLMRHCVRCQTCTLGATHPHSLSSHKALSKWEAERSDTSTEVATREDVTEHFKMLKSRFETTVKDDGMDLIKR